MLAVEYDHPVKTISVKLPESLLAALSAFSRESGAKRSAVIRAALSEHLARSRKFPKGSVADLGGDLWGTCDGPRDLSTNPKHLRGFGK
jgi:Ribbon-helix-helix protein, copG family